MEEPGVKLENETKKSVMAAVKSLKSGESGKKYTPTEKITSIYFL